ncbi:PorP/SprF family type IX secretion system membrane protein [Mucilaginibacter angelicae]|uniref:PorP/SprF family type IX secretion system membrane protein n=1 Tax=Mucilaginibacter angelicae TaxID=869718 RepID=A0ABV6LF32_9SPHI
MGNFLKFIKTNGRLVAAVGYFTLAGTMHAGAQSSYTYSQYMNNLLPLNQAYSLLDKNASVTGLYRSQWTGIEGAPRTFMFNTAIPLEQMNGATGITVLNDQFAVERVTEANAFLAKGVQLGNESFLGVSLNAGIRQYVANYSTLATTDPSFRNDVHQTRPNVGFSVMLYAPNYYIGFALPELTIAALGGASVQDNSYFKSHFNVSAAYLIDNGSDFKIKPAFLAYYTKNQPLTADFSTTLYMKNIIGLGADYRTGKQMSGIISINSRNVRIGYSYQFGTTGYNLGGVNNAVHEVILTYRFGKHLDNISLL